MNAHAEWLNQRKTGIGGSDAAAILGLSQYRTPFQVYQEKVGLIESTPDNENMLWGRVLEPVIRQQYADRTGRVVRIPEQMLRHDKHPFMIANVDGVTDDGRLLEIKTARTSKEWGEPGSDQIPQAYLIQVQHYLAVTALPVADVSVLIGGSDYRQYEIPADDELQEMIIEGEAKFWSDLQSGIAPEPISFADAQARYGRQSTAGEVQASDAVLQAIKHLEVIRADIKRLETMEEEEKAVVMLALGDLDTLVHQGKTLATWKASAPAKRFDSKAFQDANPDLYKQFIKTGEPSRRLLIK